uniref:F-box domain-containing protein n=1 Tax=Caenorhabditis tropicalis TaxID=1561998 RepID=A0A1I7U444_9PELO
MSTEFQFPLLKLPWVCLEHFLNTSGVFNVFDLITFSLISKKCYRIVKSLKHRELKVYDIIINDNCIEIMFVRSELKIIGKWKLNLGDEWKTNPLMELYYFQPDDDNWVPARALQLLTDDPESSAVNVFRYLMALFPRPVEQVNVTLDEFNQSEQIVHSFNINECETLRINNENKMSKSEVIRILKITKIKRAVSFNVDLEPGFPYENDLILPKKFSFPRGQATREMIFELKFHILTAIKCKLSEITPNDFIDFVMRWYNSNDTSFEMLLLHWGERTGELDLETSLPLDLHEYDENRRGRYVRVSRNQVIDTSIGWDFQRSDGLWATILRTRSKALYFYVWHDCSSRDFVFNGFEEFI